jgi:transposase
MKDDWLLDGSKIPDEVMNYFRKRAIPAMREKGQSPEVVAEGFGFDRSGIYEWLQRYAQGGYPAVASRQPPGAAPVIPPAMDRWRKHTVLNSLPVEQGYDPVRWNRALLADLIQKKFEVTVSGPTVSVPWKALGLSYQPPCYRERARKEQEGEWFLEQKVPRIQRLAPNLGAASGFEDEAGVGVMTRSGRTWGEGGTRRQFPSRGPAGVTPSSLGSPRKAPCTTP